MKKQVVIWFGIPLRKLKFIGRIAGHNYWWCVQLNAPHETHIYSLKEPL